MSGSDRFPNDNYDRKMQRVDDDTWENAQVGVEYYCNDHRGGAYGVIYRQYFGAKVDLDEIAAVGIDKLIDFAFEFNGTVGHGASTNGTATAWLSKGTDKVVVHCSGTSLDEGWFDYTKAEV